MATVKINSIHIQQFKGVADKTFDFNGNNATIKAENGVGKTTIADAYFWVFADRDSQLNANPKIRPNNLEESLPRVEVVLDVDGVQIMAAKQQKMTKSKPDENGVVKVALVNAYEVNAVPKSEKDFKAYFLDRDVDLTNFLELSHPDVFTSGMGDKKTREKMRSVLFEMCSDFTDYDCARRIPGLEKLATLLETYKLEEIEAMHASTMRRANEQLEQIPFRIVGMEESKVTDDFAELVNSRDLIKAELEMLKDKPKPEVEGCGELVTQLQQIRSEIFDYKSRANDKVLQAKADVSAQLSAHKAEATSLLAKDRALDDVINVKRREIDRLQDELRHERDEYLRTMKEQFKDDEKVCPNCGKPYTEEEIEKRRANFEDRRQTKLDGITNQGNMFKSNLDIAKAKMEELQAEKKNLVELLAVNEKNFHETTAKLAAMPIEADFTGDATLAELESRARDIQQQIDEKKAIALPDTNRYRERELNAQLVEVEKKLSRIERNSEIDEQIATLRRQQLEYEQSKANCEQILKVQIPELKKHKNDALAEEINSHFSLVKFKLFDYQKNGTYIDVCEPMIDGKSFSTESNGALKVLANLDIVSGLQKFYGLTLPVIADGFEAVTDNTESRINTDYQLIKLRAENGYKEITIEEGK